MYSKTIHFMLSRASSHVAQSVKSATHPRPIVAQRLEYV